MREQAPEVPVDTTLIDVRLSRATTRSECAERKLFLNQQAQGRTDDKELAGGRMVC